MRIIFKISIVIKIVQKLLIINMSKIGISNELAPTRSVPKSGQPLYRYLTKIWTSTGIYKQTLINNSNKAKLEKRKKQTYFFKFFKKWKISNRCKFYGLKVFKTKKAVGQNLDKLVTTLSKKTVTTFSDNSFFENYLLLFLTELFPDDFSINYSCDFNIWSLTFHATTLGKFVETDSFEIFHVLILGSSCFGKFFY